MPMIVDMHSHFVPSSWPDLAARYGGDDWPGIRHTAPGKYQVTSTKYQELAGS